MTQTEVSVWVQVESNLPTVRPGFLALGKLGEEVQAFPEGSFSRGALGDGRDFIQLSAPCVPLALARTLVLAFLDCADGQMAGRLLLNGPAAPIPVTVENAASCRHLLDAVVMDRLGKGEAVAYELQSSAR
jgi:hypothetical protein